MYQVLSENFFNFSAHVKQKEKELKQKIKRKRVLFKAKAGMTKIKVCL